MSEITNHLVFGGAKKSSTMVKLIWSETTSRCSITFCSDIVKPGSNIEYTLPWDSLVESLQRACLIGKVSILLAFSGFE